MTKSELIKLAIKQLKIKEVQSIKKLYCGQFKDKNQKKNV
jgi:hypothetical protein